MKLKNKLKYVVLISAITACTISIINKLFYLSAIIKNKTTSIKGHFFDWRFGKIFYTKTGSGSPVLLIHDLDVISSSAEWKNMATSLSEKHTVYTIDLLGCGLSDKPYLTYTNYLYVQLISDFIKSVIGHKTNVIASGSSSSFVLMACHNDGELFNKIMILNPDDLFKLNYIPRKRSISLKILIDTPVIGTLIYNILFTRNNVQNQLNAKFYNLEASNVDYIDTCYENAHLQNCSGKYLFASIQGSYTNANIIHALKEINHSISILGGESEHDIQTIIENYCYYNPSIESYIISDSKHYPHLEKPEAVLDQIHILFENQY